MPKTIRFPKLASDPIIGVISRSWSSVMISWWKPSMLLMASFSSSRSSGVRELAFFFPQENILVLPPFKSYSPVSLIDFTAHIIPLVDIKVKSEKGQELWYNIIMVALSYIRTKEEVVL